MENSGDKGFLSGGVRVSEESNVFAGESNRGTVINATERKSTESGDLKANDRHDVSNNRIAEKVSPNNRWESWGVMNMVGRVLGGKLCMDDEVEDVKDSENWGQVNLVGDMNAWQDVIGEPASENQGEVNQVGDMNAWQDVTGEPASENQGEVNQVADMNMWQDVTGEPASENQGEVNQVADMNTWQDVTGEPTSASGIGIKGTDINSDSVDLDLGCPVGGNSLNGNQDLVFQEIGPDERLEYEEINYVEADVWRRGHGETEEVNDVEADVLIPKGCGSQDLLINEIVPDIPLETEKVNDVKADMLTSNECGEEIEKVGEYNVSDLVWGKVKSHPWWPGQIFAASAASDKAKKYFKKESYLVAYFGDESFAWNEGSKLMPFKMHFSEMEKQSSADGFSHAVSSALDETARRVELGLSCPCLAQEVRDEIKFQIFENAGIKKESSIISGGDSVSDAARFSPGDALQFLESLAKCPQSEHDRLQFTISKAQLLAYTRWKGRYQLPFFEQHIGLLEDDTQFDVMGEGNYSMKVMEELPSPFSDAANDVSSENRKLMATNGSDRKRKELLGDEERPKLKEKSMSVLMSSESSSIQKDDKKSVKRTSVKVDSSTSSNSKSKRQKTLLSTGAATCGIDVTLASNGAGKSQIVEIFPAEIPTPDMVLSKLTLAAKKPMQGHDAMIPVVGWLREFRDSVCLGKSSLADQEKEEAGKHRRKQPSQTADISALGGSEDSYWTDRIIQSYSQDQTLFGSQKPYEKDAQLEADVAAVPKLDDNKESKDLDTGNQSAPTNVVADRPTAFTLRFKSLDSIPSIENLNEIFSRFGNLYEAETKILVKSKSAKVIFKRPVDAETAFSSAGKYSIFGSSLVSYRLRYVTQPLKSEKILKKKKKKGEQDKEGTSQKVDAV